MRGTARLQDRVSSHVPERLMVAASFEVLCVTSCKEGLRHLVLTECEVPAHAPGPACGRAR